MFSLSVFLKDFLKSKFEKNMIQQMKFSLITLLLLILISCNSSPELPDAEIGNDFVDVSSRVLFIDTLEIEMSTFKFDSIIANNPPRLLIGNYSDDVFGTVNTKTYVQVRNSVFFIDDDAQYDSVAFVLDYDKYFYNDTLSVQKLNIFEVTDDIKPEETFYYNTTEFPYNNIPLGELDFRPRPRSGDSLFVKLNDFYGASIFEDIQENEINTTEDFTDKYKGLLIEGAPGNSSILGFKNTSFLRIYYTEEDEFGENNRVFDIPLASENTFNNITSETTGTLFDIIQDQETILPSSSNDNNSYIQNGIGLVTRLKINDVKSLYNIPGEGTILNAALKLTIKKRTRQALQPTRDSLGVFIVNKKSEILGNLIDPINNTQVVGLIDTNQEEFDIVTYEFFILPFLEQQLNSQTNEELFLAIYSQDFGSSVNKYILYGEEGNEDLKAKIEILYAIYDNE